MAGHFCIEQLIKASPLPVINAIPAINEHFSAHGIGCVGLLGTNGVMKSKLYGGITSAEVIAPQEDVFERVSEEYFALARSGKCTDEQRAFFFGISREMISRGADAVMLAGTDLCLAFDGFEPGFPWSTPRLCMLMHFLRHPLLIAFKEAATSQEFASRHTRQRLFSNQEQ